MTGAVPAALGGEAVVERQAFVADEAGDARLAAAATSVGIAAVAFRTGLVAAALPAPSSDTQYKNT